MTTTTTTPPRLARCEDCGFQTEATEVYPRPGGFEIALCPACRMLPGGEGHRCQAPDSTHLGAPIPAQILAMLQDRWEIQLSWLQPQTGSPDRWAGHYYAELTRWGMAKTGSQRKRIWAAGGGNTPTEALLECRNRLIARGEVQP